MWGTTFRFINAADIAHVQRKLMCGWCFILLIFLRVYSRKSFLTPGYVTPHSKNVVVRNSYPSFSRLCCPVCFSSSNTIACTQEVHYVHYWYSHIFTLSSDTIRDTSFFHISHPVRYCQRQRKPTRTSTFENHWKLQYPKMMISKVVVFCFGTCVHDLMGVSGIPPTLHPSESKFWVAPPNLALQKKVGNIYRNLEWCLSKNNNLSKIDAIPQKHVPCSFKHVQFQPLQSRWYSSSEN